MRHQYEERLRSAESRILAITKERDALRRTSAQDSTKDSLIKEKDEIIEEVLLLSLSAQTRSAVSGHG